MSRRSTHAAWDPTLRSRFAKFTPSIANGHGWIPRAKRFTRLLERAIAEKVRERQAAKASRAKAA